MTAPGGWCVEPLVVERQRRTVHLFRVTRMGVFVGEVASPQQLAKLGVPVAERAGGGGLETAVDSGACDGDGRKGVIEPLPESRGDGRPRSSTSRLNDLDRPDTTLGTR